MNRKMAFYELGRGRLAQDVQAEFETAQRAAAEIGGRVTLNLTINIEAERGNPEGAISWSVKSSRPKIDSREYTTEIRGGLIVAEGESLSDLLQTRLDLNLPDIMPEGPRAMEGGTK